MNKFAPIALAASLATFAILPIAAHAAEGSQSVRAGAESAAPAVAVSAGKMLYTTTGQRVAAIYRVTQAGVVQIILDGKLVTVPNASLSESGGKIATSLTKSELAHAH